MREAYRADISSDEIKELPILKFDGEIVVVDNMAKFENNIKDIFNHDFAGIDTETRPSFQKGFQYKVSLLQIFCKNKCYLFRLNMIGFPDELRLWLENESIKKVGLSLHDDMRELRKHKNISPQGLIDLQTIAKDYGIEALSLRKIAAIVLGGQISKRQQLSNWEAPVLNEKQQVYAATDAWSCLKIYNQLTAK